MFDIFNRNKRLVKKLYPLINEINAYFENFKNLAALELKEKYNSFRNTNLDDSLTQVFALVKAAAYKLKGKTFLGETWEMVHFDVQLMAGICMHRGMIAEMGTGEGKTLAATLSLALNALSGNGAHCVTTNDYLSLRDANWMGEIYKLLGISVGCIQHSMTPDERKAQYLCDITYGTSSEFGFDYLRDFGTSTNLNDRVQRGYNYALIDEVDSLLIDEAKTPLVISGFADYDSHQYNEWKGKIQALVKKQTLLCEKFSTEADKYFNTNQNEAAARWFLIKMGCPRLKSYLSAMEDVKKRRVFDKFNTSLYGDVKKDERFKLLEELYFVVEHGKHEADLTEKGRNELGNSDSFVLPEIGDNTNWDNYSNTLERIHNISQLLKAYCLYEKDVHYVVNDNNIIIIDENTGRLMDGRRWGDGLHGAVEAKENVKIQRETRTLATVTIQNFFRMYRKLSGMTGTADTEAAEFTDIYGMNVAIIPPNRPCIRIDEEDYVCRSEKEKYEHVISTIKDAHKLGQPILVGTASVASSEKLSKMLIINGLKHNVLNARNNEKEAHIVADAGKFGAITISTNMAGRGTDIKLGNDVKHLGLLVIGTERNDSRRIDRQLRGRAGRQGDPGKSMFFVSFEDDLMVRYGSSERMTNLMERLLEPGQVIQSKMLSKSIAQAQKAHESSNYMSRKNTIEYDDIVNIQRNLVYDLRTDIINGNAKDFLYEAIEENCSVFSLGYNEIINAHERRMINENKELEKHILLIPLDTLWQEHLTALDEAKEGANLQSYAQSKPIIKYKLEAFKLFEDFMKNLKITIVSDLFKYTSK